MHQKTKFNEEVLLHVSADAKLHEQESEQFTSGLQQQLDDNETAIARVQQELETSNKPPTKEFLTQKSAHA